MKPQTIAMIGMTALAAGIGATAQAQTMEKVRVSASFVGLWDTSQPTFCKERGEFQKAGLDVDIISSRGGSETVQAVTAGGMDIAYSPGTNAVIAAIMQGAPIKIISSEFIGSNDTFLYVRADSPIKALADIKGKSVSFPRPGGASEAVLLGLKAEKRIDFKMVATGGLDATRTMVMTKQVDVGYSFPPYGIDAEQKGEIRILFAGDVVESLRDVTARVNIARTDFIKNRRVVAAKFMDVLDRCIDWAYANKAESAKMYAALNKVSDQVAQRAIDFYKRDALSFAPVRGFDDSIKRAVEGKFIDKAPTAAQAGEMIDIVYWPKKTS